MRFFVGIDPSITNTGVVVLDEAGGFVSAYNSSVVKKRKGVSDIELYRERTDGIIAFLRDFTKGDNEISAISYEGYSFGSVHRGQSLAEFGGILKFRILEEFGLRCQLPVPTEVKKFATSKGNALKERVMRCALDEAPALAELGKKLTTDVCDAYFLAKMSWYCGLPDAAVKFETNRSLVRARLEWRKEFCGRKE